MELSSVRDQNNLRYNLSNRRQELFFVVVVVFVLILLLLCFCFFVCFLLLMFLLLFLVFLVCLFFGLSFKYENLMLVGSPFFKRN